uniref:Cir_N domain-containing protein n=1 Tax=Steinernema glaseri TaxID=37863 RepID=A0A1I7Y6Z5_9BILA
MNILPKKRWHVRTKENMARVRRDEAKAAEEQRQIDERAQKAEHEDRVRRLQKKAADREASMFDIGPSMPSTSTAVDPSGHVNFFTELEQKETSNTTQGNKELKAEKKKEQDEWEQKVGILTYLGGNTNELTKQKSWYERPFERDFKKKGEEKPEVEVIAEKKRKKETDGRKEKKRKRHRSRSSDSDDRSRKHKKSKKDKKRRRHRSPSTESEDEEEKKQRLQRLREERLRREQVERARTEALLNPVPIKKEPEKPKVEPKYSSQFNPQFARQNQPRRE